MVQKSGVHQLRLVVYPIYLQGFSTIPKVFFLNSPDFWTLLRVFDTCSCFHENHNTEVPGTSSKFVVDIPRFPPDKYPQPALPLQGTSHV